MAGWTVRLDSAPACFRSYPSQGEAEAVARSYQDYFGRAHRYTTGPASSDTPPGDFVRPDDPADDPEDGEQPGHFERYFR